jgi:hypothetical protein
VKTSPEDCAMAANSSRRSAVRCRQDGALRSSGGSSFSAAAARPPSRQASARCTSGTGSARAAWGPAGPSQSRNSGYLCKVCSPESLQRSDGPMWISFHARIASSAFAGTRMHTWTCAGWQGQACPPRGNARPEVAHVVVHIGVRAQLPRQLS